jgi:hypothetical protein
MLRIHALSPDQHREVRHWLCGDDPHLARRAQFVLWSARGWSVPAMAHALGCCLGVLPWGAAVGRCAGGCMPSWTPASPGCWVARHPGGRARTRRWPFPPSRRPRPHVPIAWSPWSPSPCLRSGASSRSPGSAIQSAPISSGIGPSGDATNKRSLCRVITRSAGLLHQTSSICGCSTSAMFLIGSTQNGGGARDGAWVGVPRPRVGHGD